MLKVLGRTMTYEVDQILTVDPYDLEALEIDPEKDYCTLVTCTPYGINTHRLLVRGHRIPNLPEEDSDQQADKGKIYVIVALIVLLIILIAAMIVLLVRARRKRK